MPSSDKRLQRVIERLRNRHPHHWKNAVWAWANKGEGNWRRKLRRFRAYRDYANHVYHWAKNNHKAKAYLHEMRAIEVAAQKKIDHLQKHHQPHPSPSPGGGLIATYDGKPVAAWFVPWLNKIRARGNWHGSLVSGFRTKEYSQFLCCQMCNACSPGSTCPGRCAGIYTNHACPSSYTCRPYEGAIDVSDYIVFRAEAHAVGAPFFNDLPADPVHFSNSGH